MNHRLNRRVVVGGGLGAGLASVAALAQVDIPKALDEEGASSTEEPIATEDPWATESPGPTEVPVHKTEYTGRYFGAGVTWDLETYTYSGDETTYRVENEDDLLFLTSLKVHMVTIVEFRFRPAMWQDLAEAIEDGYETFGGEFFGESELVGSWATNDAAGFLVRFSDYSQNYVEYTRVNEDDLWCRVRYQASYNSVEDLEGTAESLVGAWIEGEPMVRAVDPAELIATIETNV